jgi:hypothetical protein
VVGTNVGVVFKNSILRIKNKAAIEKIQQKRQKMPIIFGSKLIVVLGANVKVQQWSNEVIDWFRKVYKVYDLKHKVRITQKNL